MFGVRHFIAPPHTHRYETLGGSGFQAACNPATFDVLRRRWDVRCELFASPLNCRWASFCSAFADTDAPFGSPVIYQKLSHSDSYDSYAN